MARSGVNTLTFTARDIIGKSLSVCNARDVDQGLEGIDLNEGMDSLNLLVKNHQKENHLWKKTQGVVFLDVGKTDYNLGPAGDEACDFDDFVETTLSADEASGQALLTVTSSTGMTAADVVGVMLDSGTRHWTTIVSVDSSTQITVTVALTGAAASGATVYTYTSLIPRPLRILPNSRYRQSPTSSEIPIERVSGQYYFDQTDKTSQGTVTQDYFQPNLDDSRYYVWQTADDGDSLVRITYERPLEVFVATSDDPDFPSEWFYPLVYELAVVMGPEYKVTPERMQIIIGLRNEFLAEVLGRDQETSSIDVQPEM